MCTILVAAGFCIDCWIFVQACLFAFACRLLHRSELDHRLARCPNCRKPSQARNECIATLHSNQWPPLPPATWPGARCEGSFQQQLRQKKRRTCQRNPLYLCSTPCSGAPLCLEHAMYHLPSKVSMPVKALQWRWLGIVHQQQKVVTSAGLHPSMQEPFAYSEVRCLHSVTQDVLLFEQVVLQNSVLAR